MPLINRQLFAGTDKLSGADWESISAPDISGSSLAKLLDQYGWEKKGAAAIGLRLEPDNTSVEAARVVLLGSWGKKVQLQAKKLFLDAAEDTLLEVELPDLNIFRFKEGDMWSQFIPQAGGQVQIYEGREGAE